MSDITFFPTNLLGRFDNLEIHPCAEVEPGIIEQVDDKEAQFYSVYVRYGPKQNKDGFGGLECIADCGDKKSAEELVTFLKDFVNKYSIKEV